MEHLGPGNRHERAAEVARAIGVTVATARTELGLDQATTASLAEVSERFLRSVEKGKPTVQLAHLLRVLDVLGLTLSVDEVGRG
jgi:HTH-type transcriptional regulator / antitoxin HipB